MIRFWPGRQDLNRVAIAASFCFLVAGVVLLLQYFRIGLLIQVKDVLHHEDIALGFTAFGLGLIWGSGTSKRLKVLSLVSLVSMVLLILLAQVAF
jgi:hypothetical protein